MTARGRREAGKPQASRFEPPQEDTCVWSASLYSSLGRSVQSGSPGIHRKRTQAPEAPGRGRGGEDQVPGTWLMRKKLPNNALIARLHTGCRPFNCSVQLGKASLRGAPTPRGIPLPSNDVKTGTGGCLAGRITHVSQLPHISQNPKQLSWQHQKIRPGLPSGSSSSHRSRAPPRRHTSRGVNGDSQGSTSRSSACCPLQGDERHLTGKVTQNFQHLTNLWARGRAKHLEPHQKCPQPHAALLACGLLVNSQ